MNTPDSNGASQRTQRGIAGSARAGLAIRNATQAGSIDSPSARASRSATAPGARRRPRSSGPSSSVMIRALRSSCVRRLASGRRGSVGASKSARTWSSKKWANGPCPTSCRRPAMRSVSVTSPSDGIGPPSGSAVQRCAQARVERACPQPGLVHDAEAVGESRVLGGREDPPSTLELADPAQPLEPGRVEEVLLGHVLGGQPGRGRFGRTEPLGQFDVPVDRVADEVDGGEGMPPDRSGQGTQIRDSAVHLPTLPRRSVARTRMA